MIVTVTVWSRAVDAEIDVEVESGSPVDAFFTDTGVQLSDEEWNSLLDNASDMLNVTFAVEEEHPLLVLKAER